MEDLTAKLADDTDAARRMRRDPSFGGPARAGTNSQPYVCPACGQEWCTCDDDDESEAAW
jgi:hypothetical protein